MRFNFGLGGKGVSQIFVVFKRALYFAKKRNKKRGRRNYFSRVECRDSVLLIYSSTRPLTHEHLHTQAHQCRCSPYLYIHIYFILEVSPTGFHQSASQDENGTVMLLRCWVCSGLCQRRLLCVVVQVSWPNSTSL